MDIKQIKEKYNKLIDINPKGNYGYFNEKLTEEEVLKFEREHNIKLPFDYRLFITTMFDGCVGPPDIMPIEEWDSYYGMTDPDFVNKLSEPFLLTRKQDYDIKKKESEFMEYLNGTIRLSDCKCGCFLFLVVNGSEYGNIWVDNRASNDEIYPLTYKYKTRVTFDTWINNELDKKIKYYESEASEAEKLKTNENVIKPKVETTKKLNWLEKLLDRLIY